MIIYNIYIKKKAKWWTYHMFSPFPFMSKPPCLPWIKQRRLHPPAFMSKGSGEGWPPICLEFDGQGHFLPCLHRKHVGRAPPLSICLEFNGQGHPLFCLRWKHTGRGGAPPCLPQIQWGGSSLPHLCRKHMGRGGDPLCLPQIQWGRSSLPHSHQKHMGRSSGPPHLPQIQWEGGDSACKSSLGTAKKPRLDRTWTGSGPEIPRTGKDRNRGPVFSLSLLRNFEDRLKPVLTGLYSLKGEGHHQEQTTLLMAITITLSTTPQRSPHIEARDRGISTHPTPPSRVLMRWGCFDHSPTPPSHQNTRPRRGGRSRWKEVARGGDPPVCLKSNGEGRPFASQRGGEGFPFPFTATLMSPSPV